MGSEIKNKAVVITGASSGIGRSIAEAFLEKGAKVIVFGMNQPKTDVEFHKVDVSKEDEIKFALSKVKNIDFLINNAGIAKIESVEKMSTKDMNEMIDINFKGIFWMSKYSIPKIKDGGCIINISSLAGLKSFEKYGIYCATKSAVISLTKTLALELAQRKIRVNCIAPGVVDTGIWEKMYGRNGRKELKDCEDSIPLKRVGKPNEIAHAALFFCENEFVNGQTISVDGGESID